MYDPSLTPAEQEQVGTPGSAGCGPSARASFTAAPAAGSSHSFCWAGSAA